MKLRELINNNANMLKGKVYEDNNRIIVLIYETSNVFDNSYKGKMIFDTIIDFNKWKYHQNWIDYNEIIHIHNFMKVKEA